MGFSNPWDALNCGFPKRGSVAWQVVEARRRDTPFTSSLAWCCDSSTRQKKVKAEQRRQTPWDFPFPSCMQKHHTVFSLARGHKKSKISFISLLALCRVLVRDIFVHFITLVSSFRFCLGLQEAWDHRQVLILQTLLELQTWTHQAAPTIIPPGMDLGV